MCFFGRLSNFLFTAITLNLPIAQRTVKEKEKSKLQQWEDDVQQFDEQAPPNLDTHILSHKTVLHTSVGV